MKNEEKLLQFLTSRFPAKGPVRVGIGDDAAVLRASETHDWVVTTDQFIENVHFLRRSQPAKALGWKALARSLSDIAAMAGRPRFALVALAFPPRTPSRWVREFFSGLALLARRHRVQVIGGDLASASQVTADIQVIGEVRRGKALLRSRARPGQAIYVSGRLGLAALGQLLARRKTTRTVLEAQARKAHFTPQPRVELSHRLARRGATAMMDLSDGLSTDLHRFCRASGVGAIIFKDRIPATSLPPQLAQRLQTTELGLALHGGEDYELLFTLPKTARLPRRLLGIPLTKIGETTKKKKIVLVDSSALTPFREEILRPGGWDHFQKPGRNKNR